MLCFYFSPLPASTWLQKRTKIKQLFNSSAMVVSQKEAHHDQEVLGLRKGWLQSQKGFDGLN